ncbi:MAG: NAD(P)H-dependent glycerol-3-phosphate dehydrogenase [bacterium]|nr:NAD(P)H-dependent glycerol-3-phosphate dehydrogenase [bacterium]
MKVGVLGAGAYGLALTNILVKNKNKVILWSHTREETDMLVVTRQSSRLPRYTLPSSVYVTNKIEKAVTDKDLVVVVVPAHAFESTIKSIQSFINKTTPVLIATKGIQQETCLFLHDVFKKYCSNPYAIISGPTFARDMIYDVPIGMSLATKSKKVEKVVRNCFENEKTKFRRTNDIIGVEICASVKNVMAIASGMLEGMNVTESTRALFLTESMNDIKELIHALGGKKSTIVSFAGFGDILMTCTSKKSRNFNFGFLIGIGSSQKEIDEFLKTYTVEGMYTLKSIHKLVRRKKVKMPIINLIYDIVNGKKHKEEMLRFLIEK